MVKGILHNLITPLCEKLGNRDEMMRNGIIEN